MKRGADAEKHHQISPRNTLGIKEADVEHMQILVPVWARWAGQFVMLTPASRARVVVS